MLQTISILVIAFVGISLQATAVLAQPKPGDIYREYKWRPTADPTGTSNSRWQRVTGPDATDSPGR